MRVQESDEAPMEVGTLEAIRCKVAVAGDAAAPTAVKLELSSETDLFFHYTHVADDRSFRGIREEQHLMIELADYANVLIRSLNQAIKEPHTHLAVFIMSRDANARLDFIANMEYKVRAAPLPLMRMLMRRRVPPQMFCLLTLTLTLLLLAHLLLCFAVCGAAECELQPQRGRRHPQRHRVPLQRCQV